MEERLKYQDEYKEDRDIVTLKLMYSKNLIDVSERGKLCRYIEVCETLAFIDRKLLYTQSAVDQHIGVASEDRISTFENFIDIDGGEEEKIEESIPKNHFVASKDLSLDDFFSRPIRIATYSVDTSVIAYTSYDVWDLYTSQPSVRAKLKNYAYLRGNLHIRIHCSGTPYHYGRHLVSYQPFAKANEILKAYTSMIAVSSTYRPLALAYLSQAPGAFTIDYKENKVYDLVCPFILPKAYMRLFNTQSTSITDVTSFHDALAMGTLYLWPLNILKAVGSASTNLSMELYAYMTDVSVVMPTGTITQITTEMGKKKKEQIVGPVENISSRIATFLGHFVNIPILGPYAKASQIVAEGVRGASAILGWSKPIPFNQPTVNKMSAFQNGSYGIGYDTAFKMSLDPEQELTVDPSIMGSSEDDLAISAIVSRPSYFTNFTWGASTAVNTNLWECGVAPNVVTRVARAGPKTWIQPTALAFAAAPFQYWHGDITFRFDFVCSSFHRGKLAIFFEPNVAQDTIINSSVETNKQHLITIDLQETQEATVTIPWAMSRLWNNMNSPQQMVQFPAIGNPLAAGQFNGYISCYPLTKLVSPDGSDIAVDVYVYSSKMFFNYNCDNLLPSERLVATSSGLIDSDRKPIMLGGSIVPEEHIGELCFGEIPLSFRTLLKRFTFQTIISQSSPASTGRQFVYAILDNHKIPEPAISTASTGTTKTFFDYLRYAYVGLRGGVRFRVTIGGPVAVDNNSSTVIELQNISDSTTASSSGNTTTNPRVGMRPNLRFNNPASNAVEYEVPFYSNNLFALSFSNTLDGYGIFSNDVFEEFWVRQHKLTSSCYNDNNKSYTLAVDVAAGEDFTLLRFQGAPFWSGSF